MFTVFNRNLGVIIRVITKYIQGERRENIERNRVVISAQADLMREVLKLLKLIGWPIFVSIIWLETYRN